MHVSKVASVVARVGLAVLLASMTAKIPTAFAQEAGSASPSSQTANGISGFFESLGSAVSSIFDKKGSILKSLVEDQKYEAAAEYFQANKRDLEGSAQTQKLLPIIAESLNRKFSAQAQQIRATLAGFSSNAGAADWETIRSAAQSGMELIARHLAIRLLQQPEFSNPDIPTLATAIARLESGFRDEALAAFQGYDHTSGTLFADAYPFRLDLGTLGRLASLARNSWLKAIPRLDEARARPLIAAYGPLLPESESATSVLMASIVEVLARSRRWPAKPGINEGLQLLQVLQDFHLPSHLGAHHVQLVVIKGESARWIPHRADLPMREIGIAALPTLLKDLASDKEKWGCVLIYPGPQIRSQGVNAKSSQTSQMITGVREETNPAWAQAAEAVKAAEGELTEVQNMDRNTQAQAQTGLNRGGGGAAAFVLMAAAAGSSFAVSKAQSDVASAREQLQKTPRTVKKPVTQAYQVAVASIFVEKGRSLAVYLIDLPTAKASKVAMEEKVKHEEKLTLGLSQQDVELKTALTANQTAKNRLKDFARASNEPLQADEVLEKIIRAKPTDPSIALARLNAQVLADASAWKAAAEKSRAAQKAASVAIVTSLLQTQSTR